MTIHFSWLLALIMLLGTGTLVAGVGYGAAQAVHAIARAVRWLVRRRRGRRQLRRDRVSDLAVVEQVLGPRATDQTQVIHLVRDEGADDRPYSTLPGQWRTYDDLTQELPRVREDGAR